MGLTVLLLVGLVAPVSTTQAVAEATSPSPRRVPHDAPLTNTEAPVTLAPVGADAAVPTSEVVSLRTEHAKTFATDQPGKYTSRVYASPVHFKDVTGSWADIDMTLVPQPDGRLRSRAHTSAVSLAPLADDAQLGRVDFDLDHSVAFALEGAAAVPVNVAETLGRYADALPDVAVELRGYWAGLKEELVLASKAAPDTYLFPLTLRGLTAHLVDGEVVYEDALGKEWGRTPRGWMRDSTRPFASDDPSRTRPQTFSEGVTYELVPHEGGQALKVTLDRAWLDDPARVYPVRVDPTTTFGANTDDTYVQTNDTTRNDTFNDLNVGTTSAGANKMRSFVHFDTGFLRGRAKGIGYTRVATYLFDAWSCASRPNSMYRVTQAWWGGSMASYPGANVWEEVARRDVDGCVAHWEQWDNAGVLDLVHNWNVSQIWADHGIMLMAFDENDNTQYRHYYSANQPGAGPHLVTDWWGLPNLPDQISPGDAVYEATPTLHARYTHSNSESGSLVFDVFNSGGGHLGSRTVTGVCHGCTGTHPPTDLNDGRYQWKAVGRDGAGRYGPQTGSTWFTLDRKPYVPDQLSPATGTAGQSPPTLSARYNHPNGGNSSGQVIFKLYSGTDTFLSETWSASVCKGCSASHTPSGLADGLYKWEAVAYDGGGTSNTRAFSAASARRTFRVDTTAPPAPEASSSSHPQERTWYPQSAFQATWTEPSDPTGISGYSVVLDQASGTVPPATVSQTTRTYSASLADGPHFLHVRARDGVGNWGPTDHYEVWSDAATPGAPTVTSPSHPDSTTWYTNRNPNFAWSGGDTTSGVAGWSFVLDQAPLTEPDNVSKGATSTWGDTAKADGSHTFHVKQVNNAGTWGPATHFHVNIDATPPPAPTTTSSTHANEAVWYADADPQVSWSATDTAPVNAYAWVLDQAPSTEPSTAAPVTETSKTWTGLADGVWWLHVKARNATGTWGPTTHRAVRVDAVVEAPTVTSTSHPTQTSWYARDDVELTWAAPSQSGIAGWSYTLDGTDPDTVSEGTATARTYADMPDGTYTFKLRVLDGLGRWSGATSFTVQVDASAPTVSSTSSSTHPVEAEWYADADPSMSWSATDTAPVDGWSWTLDRIPTTTPDTASEGMPTTAGWADVGDGLWWFHVRARNATGTWGPAVHRAVRVDTTPPGAPVVGSPTHPVDSTAYESAAPAFEFPATDDSGVDGYSWVLDRTASTVPDTTSEGAADTTSYDGVGDGVHWFHVRARNGLGMWGEAAHFRVEVDAATGAPAVASSTHPRPSAWYGGDDVSLSWSRGGPVVVPGWSYVLDGSPGTTPDEVSEGLLTARTYTDLADGVHWFHVRAQTDALAWSAAAHFPLRVDGTPPAAPVVSSTTHPSQSTWYPNAHPSLSFPVTDTAPVDGYSWVLDRSPSTVPDTTSEGDTSALGFTALSDGVHWFHARARNATGAWGPTAHFAVRVDTSATAMPTVASATHPEQSAWYAHDDVSLSFSATSVSGIAGYSWVLDGSPATTPDEVSEGTAAAAAFSDVGDGTQWFHVRARNGAGVWGATAHFRVQVDDTAPTAPTVSSRTHPSETAWSAEPNAALSFPGDDTAPVDGYSWILDQSASTTPDTASEGADSFATVTPGEGTYWFHVRVRNAAGLWGTTAHYALKTDAVTGSPTISSATHPVQTVWYASRSGELQWTGLSEESGVAGYSTSVTPDNAADPGTVVTTTATTAPFEVAEDRVWSFNVRAKSNAGVWGPITSYQLRIDTAPPGAPVARSTTHSDPARWYSNDDPSFDFPASDSRSGVSGYSYELDRNGGTVPDTTAEGAASTKTYADVADGVWWFHVRARDNAGNWGPASHLQVRVDDTSPVPQSVTDSPDPLNINNPITFSVAWSDDPNGSPVRTFVCKTNSLVGGACAGGLWASSSLGVLSPRPATSASITTAQGRYDYWAFVCDAANNCSPTAQVGNFWVNDYPVLHSTSAEPREVISGETVMFRANWSDSADSVRAIVCKSNRLENFACPDGFWGNGGYSTTGESTAANPTSDADLGPQRYWTWVCDANGLCVGPHTGEFSVQPHTDATQAGTGASNTFTSGLGPEGYTHPCNDSNHHIFTWRYGSSWDFRHNMLSYPANGSVGGTANLSPEQQKQIIRAAINAGPGGLNPGEDGAPRTQPECRDWGRVPGPSWTRFRDAGTFTENPTQMDGVNGAAFIDYTRPPPTTPRNCRESMIKGTDHDGDGDFTGPPVAQMCPFISTNRTTGEQRLVEWAITFNVASRFDWTINLNGAPENELIIQAVATHEALHAAGANHTDARDDDDPLYCSRAEPHAALTMYPCTPIHKADEEGSWMTGGRSNYWPYTLGWGDMLALAEAKP